jgi:molybdenum cofactor cytidylyltransferase
LILTGGRGAGKTTLLSGLCKESLPGLTTWVVRGEGVYLEENTSGQRVRIGAFDASRSGRENRMRFQEEGIFSLAIPALERCEQSDSAWVTIDEIGYLEADCVSYREAICRLMEKKRVIAVVRKQELPFLQELCKHPEAFVVDLDLPFGNTGCVIMASGLGRRFGGNKLMADFHGAPLISRVLDATEGLFTRRVVVTRHGDVAALCRERGIEVVLHELPHRSDTVRLGLQTMQDTVDRCMFCSGDQPLLRRETVAALAVAAVNDPDSIWRTAWETTPGTPVLFPRWTFPELLALPEGLGGSCIIQQYPGQVRTVSAGTAYELKDVDTQADLSVLLER